MTLVLELPRHLEEELTQEAERIGLAAEEHVRSLLWIASALLYQTDSNPMSAAIRELLAKHSVDPREFGRTFEVLVQRMKAEPDGGVDGMLIHGDKVVVWQAKQSRNPEELASGRLAPSERPGVMGKYAYLNTSSEDYARRKQEEIDLEDGRAA